MDQVRRVTPLIARVALAALFIWSGVGKIVTPEATQAAISSLGVGLPLAAYWVTIILELGGGLALLAGAQARLAATALAMFSLATAFGFHGDFSDQGQIVHFMKNIAISGGLLMILANGPGPWSFDETRAPKFREDLA